MFEKFYRIGTLFLLAAILTVLMYDQIISRPSADCLLAQTNAEAYLDRTASELRQMLNEYETRAYDDADNINQQMFIADEYSFMTLQWIAQTQQKLLEVQVACK